MYKIMLKNTILAILLGDKHGLNILESFSYFYLSDSALSDHSVLGLSKGWTQMLQRGDLLTLYTLTSVCKFSILFSVHFQKD